MQLVNAEHYQDNTAEQAVGNADNWALKVKLYHMNETIRCMARLAGFEVTGTIYLTDSKGVTHDCTAVSFEVKHRRLNKE